MRTAMSGCSTATQIARVGRRMHFCCHIASAELLSIMHSDRVVEPSELAAEASLREAFALGDLERVARMTLECYGRDVLSFLVARLRSADAGREVFSMFAEDLWRGLGDFRWLCTMRCWVYVVARNAAQRYLRGPARRAENNEPLSQHASHLVEASTRPSTAPHLQSRFKERVRALREQLSTEDQSLLFLHVDRGLPFAEVAIVLHEGPAPLAAAEVGRAATRLRKRFERLKVELRRLAAAEGLLRWHPVVARVGR